MTARFVQLVAATGLFNPMRDSVFLNVSAGTCGWEADILAVRASMWGIEVEVKVSLSDFKADFKKGTDKWNVYGKHDRLQNGHPVTLLRRDNPQHPLFRGNKDWYADDPAQRTQHLCKQFYFAVPEDLVEKVRDLVPTYAGLVSVGIGGLCIQKQAPKLGMARKYTTEELNRLYRTAYYKHWDALYAEKRELRRRAS